MLLLTLWVFISNPIFSLNSMTNGLINSFNQNKNLQSQASKNGKQETNELAKANNDIANTENGKGKSEFQRISNKEARGQENSIKKSVFWDCLAKVRQLYKLKNATI